MDPKIVDVRLESGTTDTTSAASLRAAILSGLNQPTGKKSLPTLILYDERGLRLYDAITTDAHEYYLFPTEEAILKEKGSEIVQVMHGKKGAIDGEVVLELGAGALRKTSHLLHNLASLVKDREITAGNIPPITYYALDLERRELVRTLNQITMNESNDMEHIVHGEDYGALGAELAGKVSARGMWGTYDGGIQFIKQGGLDKLRTADKAGDVALDDTDLKLEDTDASSVSTDSDLDSSLNRKSSSSNSNSRSLGTGTTPTSPPLSTLEVEPLGEVSEAPPLHMLFLGSSLGNFSRPDMQIFLSQLPLRPGSGDTLLLGLDGDNDKKLVERAYNDPKGITKAFIMNGLLGAGRALGNESLFAESKWEYISFYNEAERKHEAYYKSIGPQAFKIVTTEAESTETILHIADQEMVNVEVSHKYSTEDIVSLFSASNLRMIQKWMDPKGLYGLYLLERPPFQFPLIHEPSHTQRSILPKESSKQFSPFNIPTVEEWKELWKAWDLITLGMIPRSMLHEKPIDLRHKCLFYLGHIPAFLDIHLSRLLEEPNTEPENYKYIFERGIDPHVDDPTQCHPHSEVPEEDSEWPTLEEILDFRDRVRQRVLNLYSDLKSGRRVATRKIARVLSMTHEHEGFHAETLLYMLIQRAGTGTLPPPSFTRPSFDLLSSEWDAEYTAFYESPTGPVVKFSPQTITLGHNDREADDLTVPFDSKHAFGWDNEHPQREVRVAEFKISWRPVTNGEFFAYWSDESLNHGERKVAMPASWLHSDGGMYVRTLYGPVDMSVARHWPVETNYDDLSTYAKVKGGRIPTLSELRAFWERFQNGFVGGSNVGFRNWHPTPATCGMKDGGKGHNGGVWEWTSTVFDNYEGFVPSNLYPGYSLDFFDQNHQVVVGGSYATIPRIAQRTSVCNFYQHNYPFAWVGARIAYDV
ncbi:hypothetical protein K439DRAFT_1410265 [Ramaria rubella]|nr:hypothetical protein K439DRAFT_1410265 [Ramaria rubella]